MTSWFSEAVAAPAPRTRTRTAGKSKPRAKAGPKPRPKAKRRTHARGAIAWILISAVVLAGVVFVNLAVLRLNLQLDSATQERSKLRAENASLASQLSSAQASPRIQSLARRQNGLVDADPAQIGYIDLSR
jgi:cell division protein FtsL